MIVFAHFLILKLALFLSVSPLNHSCLLKMSKVVVPGDRPSSTKHLITLIGTKLDLYEDTNIVEKKNKKTKQQNAINTFRAYNVQRKSIQ